MSPPPSTPAARTVPKLGVEEELLLVDPATFQVTPVATQALRAYEATRPEPSAEETPEIEAELYQQQLELATDPCDDLEALRESLVRARRTVTASARAAGARAVAVPAPILIEGPERVSPGPRYHRIYDEYGELARQALVCGMHVHVDIDDDVSGIAVIDGMRPWLPILQAVSANSPYWRGADTGYATWRNQIWSRWPTGGPRERFSDPADYRRTAERLEKWGAALDDGMLYFDVRLAASLPTVEVRVADVCTEVDDALLVAALTRALVATLAREFADGTLLTEDEWRSDLLRAAHWRASRYGMSDCLVHPDRFELVPAREAVTALIERTADVLEDAGDRSRVEALLEQLIARGGGASRQRAVFESHGSLERVVADLADRTEHY